MKNLEKPATILILFWLGACVLITPFMLFFMPSMSSTLGGVNTQDTIKEMSMAAKTLLSTRPLLIFGDKICCSIWLFFSAKKDLKSPWIWSSLGFNFGISALILYFVKQLSIRDNVNL
ncbi:MAG: hypothetical protein AAFO95_12125 [Cyanobacteria bacterium J06600_6]